MIQTICAIASSILVANGGILMILTHDVKLNMRGKLLSVSGALGLIMFQFFWKDVVRTFSAMVQTAKDMRLESVVLAITVALVVGLVMGVLEKAKRRRSIPVIHK